MDTEFDIDGRAPVALVTGGTRRVGRHIARALAAAGCDVVATSRSTPTESDAGGRIVTRALDLADPAAAAAIAEGWAASLPRLDVVVHNAGRYHPTPLDGFDPVEAERMYRVNALSPLAITARLAPLLRRSPRPGGAAVVCIGDIHAMGRPRRHHAGYAMSKAAVVELVRSLARDLAPEVRVNGVAPGVVAWPEAGAEADPTLHARYVGRVPLGRTGTPDELAEAVRWLALDARFVTGAFIPLDGGRSLA